MDNIQENIENTPQEDVIKLEDIFYMCLAKWYWFAVSLAFTMTIGVFYILRTPPAYTRSASVLIKEDAKGNSFANMEQSFADMGLLKSNTNVYNELATMRSPSLMYEVVKRLKLDMSYMTDGMFHKNVAYGVSLPVTVNMLDVSTQQSAAFTLEVSPQGELTIYDMVYQKPNEEENEDEIEEIKAKLSDTILSPMGRIIVTPTEFFNVEEPTKLYVSKTSLDGATNAYLGSMKIDFIDEESTVIGITKTDVCPARAEDILNMLITVYNENWVKDKNQIAISTSTFINERLRVIEHELGHVDENISSYKSKNLMPDVRTASTLYMTQSTETNARITEMNNQLYMTRYIRNYLTSALNKNNLLPVNSGIQNANIESQITSYNTQLLQRNSLVANSSEQNPLVVDMDRSLESMRSAIISSIDNQLETLNAQLKSLHQTEEKATSRIAASPSQAKYLLSVERQQKVKEALYLFLLQKREENELSQAFTAYNTRIITPPRGSNIPTSPRKQMILFAAFILGCAVPVGLLFVRETMNTKLRGRKDLEGINLPFVGEIPLFLSMENRQKKFVLNKSKLDKNDLHKIVVEEGNRDLINEAFRVVRTNLEFMSNKDNKSNVILTTSFNPSSGKSFITVNLAISLAIKGKKVLVVDCDLRHASVSRYIKNQKQGLATYLAHQCDNLEELIYHSKKYPTLALLPVGNIPPNPAELLYDERMKSMIEHMKEEYDYIFMDCPPIEIVADTHIISKLADRTIFVLRAGLLERTMLSELPKLYAEKKFNNLTILLNGTEGASGHYGYRYGYRYGYKYGYKYGYHSYGYYSEQK